MRTIIDEAIAIRKAHIAVGIPMIESQGFKEANIGFAMALAFSRAGYFGFPEVPHDDGSIDAMFVRDDEVVICEWKQVSRGSIAAIVDQTHRMLRFDAKRELAKHRFRQKAWTVRRLWVCDTWMEGATEWWFGRPSKISTPRPFDETWTVGRDDFQSFGDDWFSYSWLWAFTNEEKADQTPEPIRMLGTSAAEPPRGPSTRATHLKR